MAAVNAYLMDTDALLARPRLFLQQALRLQWELYVCTLSLGPLALRLVRLRSEEKHEAHDYLQRWVARLCDQYSNAILPFDADCAVVCGHLTATTGRRGNAPQLAACALVNSLEIVTRHPARYAGMGTTICLLDP
jgi:toxin FitB